MGVIMFAVIRQRFIVDPSVPEEGAFLVRGHQVSRLEGISDAVFGLALTLIVVSLKVPGSFDELVATLQGFVGSGVCVLLVLQIWNEHYLYFRRFALEDAMTRSLNGLLLFVVIAYVYPLKFLFGLFFDALLQIKAPPRVIRGEDQAKLFVIYGAGFILVYIILAVMYLHALRKQAELEMTEIEVLETRWTILGYILMTLAGALSILFALVAGKYAVFAGFVYFVIPIFMTIHGSKRADSVRALNAKITARGQPAETAAIPADSQMDLEIQIDPIRE